MKNQVRNEGLVQVTIYEEPGLNEGLVQVTK